MVVHWEKDGSWQALNGLAGLGYFGWGAEDWWVVSFPDAHRLIMTHTTYLSLLLPVVAIGQSADSE